MNIEDLIKKRAERLDVESPPPELWDGIKKEWKNERSSTIWWKAAAAIFIITSAGLLFHNTLLQQQVEELSSLGDISEEYQNLEQGYIQQVNLLEESLPMEELKQDSDFSWAFEELDLLEEVNAMYRADIGKADTEQVVSVLIDYYEKKLRLLKKLQLEIERKNKLKNDETITTDSITI